MVNTLSTIQPELVMCGGDLTEAKSSLLKAAQDEAEQAAQLAAPSDDAMSAGADVDVIEMDESRDE